MNRRGRILALGALLWAAAGAPACRGDAPTGDAGVVTAAVEARVATRANAALKPLKQGLMQALKGALASGSPADAVAVCRDRAPAIAAAAATDGVLVGRTSDRLRNPKNAPRAWVAPILAEYVAAAPSQRPPHRVVALPDGRFGYVEPIYTAPLCTTCHGAQLAPAISAKLAALYPDDQARDYAEGDLRGLFWAELP